MLINMRLLNVKSWLIPNGHGSEKKLWLTRLYYDHLHATAHCIECKTRAHITKLFYNNS